MSVSFKKIKDHMRLKNPFKGFSMDEIPFEIRYDPLTGQSTRIFDLPYRPVARPDFDELIRKSKEMKCPFCPESLEKATPLYPEEIIQGGRIHVGGAVLFPNLLPLDRYAAVCIFGSEHFIAPGDFTPDIMRDGFTAARTFIEIIARHDPDVRCFNINWNYMPPSGSSMLHPHLQVNCGEIPTYQPRLQMECSHSYFLKNGRTFWEDYMAAEQESGERVLMEIGPTFWTMNFAPQGALPDIWCICRGCRSLVEWKDEERDAFLKGLAAALRYLDQAGLYSFNVSIFSGRENDHYRVNARITPRLLLREIGNSDQTYYQVLHREPCSVRPPESVREKALEVYKNSLF
jgi:galactose-1-phosphate uridylyltransferase